MRNMFRRAIRAALFHRAVYREVGEEPEAVLHAFGTVVLAGMALSLGLSGVFSGAGDAPPDFGGLGDRLLHTWVSVMTMLLGWVLWVVAIYLIGGKFLGGTGPFRGVLRGVGVCYGPAVLLAVDPTSGFGAAAAIVGSVWVMAAAVAAVHETLKVDWLGAVLSTLVGWFIFFNFLPRVVLASLTAGG